MFDRIEHDFVRAWARRDPMRAVELGWTHPYDGRLPDAGVRGVTEDLRLLKHARAQLARVNVGRLPPPRALDAAMMERMLDDRRFELETARLWASAPPAPRLIGESLYQILSRNYAPLKMRMRRIMARLEQLPRAVEQSKSRLKRPDKILIENELETITRLPAFFHNLKEIARLNLQATPLNRLAKLVHQLQNTIEKYYSWLIIDVLSDCPPDHALAPPIYAGLMQQRGIPLTAEAMLRRVEGELARLKGRLREMGRRMKRRIPLEDLRDRLKANHPADFDGVLKYVREEVARTREFVERSGFATLPPREALYVVEMPTYLRHLLPRARTGPAARIENRVEGYLMVSPGDCDSDRLKEFNYSAMTGMAIREGYPGRHLAQAYAETHPSMIRRLYRAPETVQGWICYAEERLREMGYDDTPQGTFLYTLELIARATRALIDLKIHAGQMTAPEAVNRLIDEVGMDRVVAEAEVRWILSTPTAALEPIWGLEQFRRLRQETRDRLKGHLEDRAFHDAILSAGALPFELLRRHLEATLKPPAPAPKVKPEPKPAPRAKPRPKPRPKARPKPRRKPRPRPRPRVRPKPRRKPRPKPRPKARPKPRRKPRPKPRPKHRPKPAKRPRPKPRPKRRRAPPRRSKRSRRR
jgi:hypothetical protein